jgi:hypothetical protein
MKPITWNQLSKRIGKLEKRVEEALYLASHHDPDIVKLIKKIEDIAWAEVKYQDRQYRLTDDRLAMLERQTEILGAPQYRKVRRGMYARCVRKTKRK